MAPISLLLFSGAALFGTLTLTGASTLATFGSGSGNGGNVILSSVGNNAISLGSYTGNFNTSGGTTGGNAGNITITEVGTGGVAFSSSTSLFANGTNGAGGAIDVTSLNGTVTSGGGTISANSGSGNYNGGNIQIAADILNSGSEFWLLLLMVQAQAMVAQCR